MDDHKLELAIGLLDEFAARTGLDPVKERPTRYLWTDAFAVCTYLDLHSRTGDGRFEELAIRLVDQVHHVLGKHRSDDQRKGWISGLSDKEGEEHPTIGGLRIGKKLPERHRFGPVDPMLEWEQDGQYYHYLTKWMHALERMASYTSDARYLRWAMEMALTAHARFTYSLPNGRKLMYWKMSIDLSYPLVTSMGQHDALDGAVTLEELEEAAERFEGEQMPDLHVQIDELVAMARSGSWATDDALGAGSLLFDSWRLAQEGEAIRSRLLVATLEAALLSIDHVLAGFEVQGWAERRLAFRELGLSIGLHAVERLFQAKDRLVPSGNGIASIVDELNGHVSLADHIERFWSDPTNRKATTWMEHEDINAVMLAASLSPEEFLRI